jgi:YHS domain-containing protein
MSALRIFATLATTVLISACAPLTTQSPGQGYSPVNAVSEGDAKHLMLSGHDVVSYFTESTHKKGTANIRSDWKGVTFYFAKPEHKTLFDAAPEKYLPQYGGYCANGIVYGIPWGGSADSWVMLDGKLYIFGGQGAKDGFLVDRVKHMALADKYWKEEINDSNAFFQRSKRMIFRVPHYKSGAEVAAEVEHAKKTGTYKPLERPTAH